MRKSTRIVTVDGELLGQLVPIGGRFMFFTTHQKMLDLHGRQFESYEALYEEIEGNRHKRLNRAA